MVYENNKNHYQKIRIFFHLIYTSALNHQNTLLKYFNIDPLIVFHLQQALLFINLVYKNHIDHQNEKIYIYL